ncbi:MAG: cytochrome c3 family protein [bacterium]|nr:cytochrome c3 family protein [bacterium]
MKAQRKIFGILVLFFLMAGGGTVWFLKGLGDNRGYAPRQPFDFNHQLHAGQMQIPCKYCHYGVTRTRAAILPGLKICMNCHSVVAGDKPKIQKLKKMFAAGEEVVWTKVHDLPDFVYFSHWQHIAANLDCENCHGRVDKMKRVYQAKSLKMGWCLDCHRGQDKDGKPYKGPQDCNQCHQ